jgi:coproporphyrinogen III oxidase
MTLPNASTAARMKAFVEDLQQRLCRTLEEEDGAAHFRVDDWQRTDGGGGKTAVIEGGDLFEKGGVNTSAVWGELPERMARALTGGSDRVVEAAPFFATGLSLVLHPCSPYVPTVHANFRYFALGEDRLAPRDEWFGGGADLTPYYPCLEDAQHFHRVWKNVCDRHPAVADYDAFKAACDEYFYLPHREEARGVGGIFYDHVRPSEVTNAPGVREDPEAALAFSKDAAEHFWEAYRPIVRRRRDEPFGERERRFQKVRRGRYVEFNLVYDRGTKFGLDTGGRTESILMSLPPHVAWRYDAQYEPGTPEAQAQWFFEARDWLRLGQDAGPSPDGENG